MAHNEAAEIVIDDEEDNDAEALGGQNHQNVASDDLEPERKNRSEVHKYFVWSDEKNKYICTIGTCRYEASKDTKNSSTGNMLRHLKRKHMVTLTPRTPKSRTIKDFLEHKANDALTQEKFEILLIEHIILTDQPFTIVENESFLKLLAPLKMNVPSADTIQRKAMKLYDTKSSEVMKQLQSTPGKLSFVLDVWTSVTQIAFQGVIVAWIDANWELQEVILALDILHGSHTGTNLAISFCRILREYSLLDKVAAITTDNASNYDTFFVEVQAQLAQEGIVFNVNQQRVRCLAHIINLSCNDALKYLKREQKDGQGDVYVESDPEPDSDEDEDGGEDEVQATNSIYSRLRTAVTKIRKSVLRREMFRRQCEVFQLKHNELLKDNRTRWNSTYDMLKRLLKLRTAFDGTLQSDKKLKPLLLSQNDWNKVEEMVGFLKPFKTMTLHLETKGVPTMSLSAMIYIELYNHLESVTTANGHPEFLVEAAISACEKLNKYYPSSDALVHVVGTILDPRCKLAWYSSVGFKAPTVKAYKRAIQACWNGYKPAPAPREPEANPETPQKQRSKGDDLFAIQMKKARIEKRDELQIYLDDNVVSSTSDQIMNGPLQWWKLHENLYPNLAKMARDYLSVSGTGVPIERFFSNGPLLLVPNRRRMVPETVKKCLCLKGWLKSENQAEFKIFVQQALIQKSFGN